MTTSTLPAPHMHLAFLLLLVVTISCTTTLIIPHCDAAANADDFSKKAAGCGATASVFFFLLPKVAKESVKAVSKAPRLPETPYLHAVPSLYSMRNTGISTTRTMDKQAAESAYNRSKEAAMACWYKGTKEAVGCWYKGGKEAMAGMYNGTVKAVMEILYYKDGSASRKEEEMAMAESQGAAACPASTCFRPNPVCGKDGVTYWCGVADAECAGVEVDHLGFCDFLNGSSSRETGSKAVVLAIQSLLLVHMIWLMLAAFLVLLGLP